MRIPLSSPDITEQEIESVAAVLRGSRLSLGPKLAEFEAALAEAAGTRYAVCVSSGTAALHLSMIALGIGPGDQVIVPSFTFIAVANAVRYVGAEPVFADVDSESLNLLPERVEAAITTRTRAIVAVHTFGRPAEVVRLQQIAQRHALALIEDACEAIGAELGGQKVGSFGEVGIFAFYPNKQITTGEGGAVVTNHAQLADRVRVLRNQGRGSGDDWLQHQELGYNYRISEINCALGLGQVRRLPGIMEQRAEVARRYSQSLAACAALELPRLSCLGQRFSWFVYVVRLNLEVAQLERDTVLRELHALGVECGRYFAPIHLQPAYALWRGCYALPNTEAQSLRTIALPFFNNLSKVQSEYVVQSLLSIVNKNLLA